MAQPPVLLFMVVGEGDHPLYEADLAPRAPDAAGRDPPPPPHAHHFVLHAALDAVEDAEWSSTAMYLGVVDRFNALSVSALAAAGHARLLLLHDGRADDAARGFLRDAHELYLRQALNPFFDPRGKLASPAFDAKVRALARAYFR
jgi:hypothetical protein